jgi:beta-glucosidase
VELFDNENCDGDPLKTWTTNRIFIQSGADLPCEIVNPFGSEHLRSTIRVGGKELQNFSLRFSTVIRPAVSGDYFFATASAEGMWVTLDGKLILDGETMGYVKNHQATVRLEGARAYKLEVRHRRRMRAYEARFGYGIKEDVLQRLTGASLAEQADVAIIAAGYGRDFEGEDTDRTFELPDFQSWFIQEVAARAKKTVVVAFAGGSFETASWLDQVDALLWVSYPGMKGAPAIADILFGEVCPSGKLPFTFDADFEQNPAYPYYIHQRHDMEYGEGIYVGYRGFDKNGIAPLFPFGHGLSYTSFEYSGMQVRLEGDSAVVTLNVKNTGPVAGREVVQLYVADPVCSVDRPPKELKGFASVDLKPGEVRPVEIELTKGAFQFFHPAEKRWMSEPGEFVLMAGASAGDIRLKKSVILK